VCQVGPTRIGASVNGISVSTRLPALSLNEYTWHEAIFMVEEEKEVLFSLLLQLFYLQIALLFLLFKTLKVISGAVASFLIPSRKL
jgi:hypothetical protein